MLLFVVPRGVKPGRSDAQFIPTVSGVDQVHNPAKFDDPLDGFARRVPLIGDNELSLTGRN